MVENGQRTKIVCFKYVFGSFIKGSNAIEWQSGTNIELKLFNLIMYLDLSSKAALSLSDSQEQT